MSCGIFLRTGVLGWLLIGLAAAAWAQQELKPGELPPLEKPPVPVVQGPFPAMTFIGQYVAPPSPPSPPGYSAREIGTAVVCISADGKFTGRYVYQKTLIEPNSVYRLTLTGEFTGKETFDSPHLSGVSEWPKTTSKCKCVILWASKKKKDPAFPPLRREESESEVEVRVTFAGAKPPAWTTAKGHRPSIVVNSLPFPSDQVTVHGAVPAAGVPAPVAAAPAPATQPQTSKPEAPVLSRADAADEARAHDLCWLNGMVTQAAAAEHEIALAKAELAVLRLAIAKLQARIAKIEAAMRSQNVSADLRSRMQDSIRRLRDQQANLVKQQDQLSARTLEAYERVVAELDARGSRLGDADLRTAAASLKAEMQRRRELGTLELALAAGRREVFNAQAQQLLREQRHVEAVRLMQCCDAMERGQPRGALQAARLALASNPQSRAAATMVRQLEVGYLRAIDADVLGEGAAVRAACAQALEARGEEGLFGAIKDIVTAGVSTSLAALGGKGEADAEFAGTIQMDASATHAGLMLVQRLREKSLTFDQMRKLNNQAFQEKVREYFGKDISRTEALQLRLSMAAAFQRPDLARLASGDIAPLQVDRGQDDAFAASSSFDPTWMEMIGDAVNVKNVLLMLGPAAVVRGGAGAGSAGEGLTAAGEAAEIVRVKDVLAGWLRLPELAARLQRSRLGDACVKELLKFETSAGTTTKLLGEGLVQQGVVEAGAALGGPAGALAAEVATSFGVGDMDGAVKAIRSGRMSSSALRQIAEDAGEAALRAEARSAAPDALRQLDDALVKVEKGGQDAATALRKLEELRDSLRTSRSELLRQTGGELDDAARLEAARLSALEKAAGEAAANRPKSARTARDTVIQIEKQAQQAAARAREQTAVCLELTNRTATPAPAPAAPVPAGGKPELQLTNPTGLSQVKPEQVLIENPALEARAIAPPPPSAERIKTRAQELAQLDYRAGGATRAADQAVLRGDHAEAARLYEELIATNSLPQGERVAVLEKLVAARATQAAVQRRALRGSNSSIAELEPAETSRFAATPKERIKPILDSEGKRTISDPQKLLNDAGQPEVIFKKTQPEIRANRLDVKAEVAAMRFGQLLGVKVAPCAAGSVMVDGVKQEGVIARFIPDATDLLSVDSATVSAYRKELAEARVLAAIIGDHDRHAGNYLLTKDGSLYSIDHGLGRLVEADGPDGMVNWADSPEKIEAGIVTALEYRMTFPGRKNPNIGVVDRQITLKDADQAIRKIEQMQESDFRAILKGVCEEGMETQRAVQTLMIRKKHLRKAFEKSFPNPPVAGAGFQLEIRRFDPPAIAA